VSLFDRVPKSGTCSKPISTMVLLFFDTYI
jgi:hypothetical protein